MSRTDSYLHLHMDGLSFLKLSSKTSEEHNYGTFIYSICALWPNIKIHTCLLEIVLLHSDPESDVKKALR